MNSFTIGALTGSILCSTFRDLGSVLERLVQANCARRKFTSKIQHHWELFNTDHVHVRDRSYVRSRYLLKLYVDMMS